jgi:indole-3-glycerol phosphate synthase
MSRCELTSLHEIVSNKRTEIEKRRARIPLAEYRIKAENAPETRDFADALRGDTVALIAEIKPASPSQGIIRKNFEPVVIARTFAANGAAALSILTDRKFFGGEPNNLKAARVGALVPLLRKDFIIDEYQVYESRAWQADAILLIVRLLDDKQLRDYRLLAESLGMSALVEVHDERELERALGSNATLIGVNNRNLENFSVDLATTERLAPLVPGDLLLVSESGIKRRIDVEQVSEAGVDAVLVGQALMEAADMVARVRDLTGVRRRKDQVRNRL